MEFSADSIRAALAEVDAFPFGNAVHFYPQVGSTNVIAREMAHAGAPEGTIIVADEQTSGRGRMGRTWVAPPGTGLLMSVLLRPALVPEAAFRSVMACGLAASEAVEEALTTTVDVKWPNDLQIGGKKLVGILPESAITGDRLEWVIVGMGINVNQLFPPDDPLAPTATSLRVESGQPCDRTLLLAALLARLKSWYVNLAPTGDDDPLSTTWRARCVTLGQRIRVQVGNEVFEGVATRLDAEGALWLDDPSGRHHRLTAGEATVLQG